MFILYRYEGESKEEVENETSHLSELLKKIEERKKQRIAEKNKSTLEADKNNLKEPKKKKKKHLQDAKDINDSHIKDKNETNEEISERTELDKVWTKKKKKRKHIEIQDHSAVVQETEELEEIDETFTNGKKSDDNENITEEKISKQNNFTILGAKPQKKKREVKRVLPSWLVHPEIVSVDLNSGPSLEEFDSILDAKLIEILKANGIAKLFPVQSNVIRWLHKCNMDRKLGWWVRDTCVSAPTGSGKYLQKLIMK